jgi:transcriptional regulator with XRE-family HTH domain
MRIIDFIKSRRLELGMSEDELADQLGVNIHWVFDLETDEDEINGLSIPKFKKLCSILDVKPVDIYKLVPSNLESMKLSELIKMRRNEKYWSVDDLSDRIGYESIVVESIENDGNQEAICVDALKKIAMELDLPLSLVLEKL